MTTPSNPDDIVFLSASATSAAIRAGRFTATDAVNAYLSRIDAIDGDIKAYITVTREEALGAASDIDAALHRGDDNLINAPLFGAPVAIKDQFNTAGILTSNGSRAYAENVPSDDSTVVSRLKAAGADPAGQAQPQRAGHGRHRRPALTARQTIPGASGTPPASPAAVPAQPWPPTCAPPPSARTPAAADAAPRPTATPSDCAPPSPASAATASPPCVGSWTPRRPMTKTVEDCALVLGAIAGYDPLDPTTSRRPVPDYYGMLDGDIRGMRIGRMTELCDAPDMHPDVRRAVDDALETLSGLGAEISDISLSLTEIAGAIFVGIADTEGAGARDDLMRRAPELLDRASRTRLQSAALVPAKVENRAMKARVLLRLQFEEAFRQVDVLVCPTAPYPAPRHDALTAPFESADDVRQRFFFRRSYTGCYPLAGMPAVSIPGGFTDDGLPIGLQLGGGPFAEATILRAAYAYQQATDWHTRRAPV